MSNVNPFAPPTSHPIPGESQSRSLAIKSTRLCLAILLVPGIYNFAWYHAALTVPPRLVMLYGIANAAGLALLVLSIWLFGLIALEFVTFLFFKLFGRTSELAQWSEILHAKLNVAPAFALGGAALWICWIIGFYELEMDFFSVSVPIGIAAHLLAAGLYIPLFVQWFRLERSSKAGVAE